MKTSRIPDCPAVHALRLRDALNTRSEQFDKFGNKQAALRKDLHPVSMDREVPNHDFLIH